MINARPGYLRSAASNTFTWLESRERGRFVIPLTVSMAFSIIVSSSMPPMPILISRISAPQASCSSARSDTISMDPARSCSCSFFLPVGLIRSPTIIKLSSRPKDTVCRSLVRKRFPGFCLDITGMSPTASFNARICAGVVPQQPPTTEAPASTIPFILSPKAAGSIS